MTLQCMNLGLMSEGVISKELQYLMQFTCLFKLYLSSFDVEEGRVINRYGFLSPDSILLSIAQCSNHFILAVDLHKDLDKAES